MKKLVGILVLIFCLIVFSNLVSAATTVQVYGNLDTQLLSGQKISFKDGRYEIASSQIGGNKYGYQNLIFLKSLTYGDKVKIYIGNTYVDMITIDKKVVQHDIKAAHLVPQIISGTKSTTSGTIDEERFAKSSNGFLYVIVASLIFIALAGSGLIFATRTGVIKLKKKSPEQQTQKQTTQSQSQQQAIQSLKNYVDYYRKQGYSDEQIKQGLIKGGWDENTLNQFLR